MPEISRIKLPDDTVYEIKDSELRYILSGIYGSEEDNSTNNNVNS